MSLSALLSQTQYIDWRMDPIRIYDVTLNLTRESTKADA